MKKRNLKPLIGGIAGAGIGLTLSLILAHYSGST